MRRHRATRPTNTPEDNRQDAVCMSSHSCFDFLAQLDGADDLHDAGGDGPAGDGESAENERGDLRPQHSEDAGCYAPNMPISA